MKKNLKTKIEKQIKKVIGDSWQDSDQIALDELICWLEMAEVCKNELMIEAKADQTYGWQTMTKYSMCAKQIQSYLKTLGITRQDRMKIKVAETKTSNSFDLNKFLNEN